MTEGVLDDSSSSVQDALRLCASEGDEERFVGLVLAARVLPFHPQPDVLLGRALGGCGLVFIERLLRTSPDSCASAHAFRPLALKLLARHAADGVLKSPRGHVFAALSLGAFDAETAQTDGADTMSVQADASSAECTADALQLACALASDPAHASAIVRDSSALVGLLSPPLSPARVEGACAFVSALGGGLRLFADGAAKAGGADALAISVGMHSIARTLATAAEAATGAQHELRLPLLSALCLWLGLPARLWGTLTSRPRHTGPPAGTGERAAPAEWLGTLQRVLGAHLSTRLPPAARADALELCAAALLLFGASWTVPPPQPQPQPQPQQPQPQPAPAQAVGAAAAAPASVAPAAAAPPARGAFANLLVQLSAVELAMGLRAPDGSSAGAAAGGSGGGRQEGAEAAQPQPEAQGELERVRCVLACAAIVEAALVELHADADDEDGEGEPAARGVHLAAGGHGEACWVRELDDGSLLAIHRAVLGVVEATAQFAEDLQHSQQGAAEMHPLAPVAARLLAAWLVQPSAAHANELYARVRNVSESLMPAAKSFAGGASLWSCVLASSV